MGFSVASMLSRQNFSNNLVELPNVAVKEQLKTNSIFEKRSGRLARLICVVIEEIMDHLSINYR